MQGAQMDSQIAVSTHQIAALAAVPEPSGVVALMAGTVLSRRIDRRDRERLRSRAVISKQPTPAVSTGT
jgi:hypothetical protein